jgi:hypothetical protein
MSAIRKPTIPEVLARFVAYHRDNPTWGALHSVLADGNVSDGAVASCLYSCIGLEGEDLCRLLLRMSKTQRRKLPGKVHEVRRLELEAALADGRPAREEARQLLAEFERREAGRAAYEARGADFRRMLRTREASWGARLPFFRSTPPADVALAVPVYGYEAGS